MAAFLIVIAAVGVVGVVLLMHRLATVPMSPMRGSGFVVFPTKMVSPTSGWALVSSAGYSNPSELWRTTDGANSWTNVSPPSLPDRQGLGGSDTTYFLDATHAWVGEAGGPDSLGDHFLTFRTADGGRTWHEGAPISTAQLSNSQLDFIDADNGWLLLWRDGPPSGWPTLFSTHDGGLHWSLASLNAGLTTPLDGLIPGGGYIAVASAATVWLMIGLYQQVDSNWTLSREILLVTHDSGLSWQPAQLPITPSPPAVVVPPVFFGQHGFILLEGPAPALLVSSDGGNTWLARAVPWESAWAVGFVDANHGWAVAGTSSQFAKNPNPESPRSFALPLYRTADGGQTWIAVKTNLPYETRAGRLFDFYFVDQETAFAIRLGASGPSELLKTRDGGRTWTVVEVCNGFAGLVVPPMACPRPSP